MKRVVLFAKTKQLLENTVRTSKAIPAVRVAKKMRAILRISSLVSMIFRFSATT
jgi:hypothetical protein